MNKTSFKVVVDNAANGCEFHCEIDGPVRSAEAIRRRDQPVVGPRDAPVERRVVAFARDVQHGRAARPERLDRKLIQRPRAGEGAEDAEHGAVARQVEQVACLFSRDGPRAGRDRPASHAVLAPAPAADRVGEEHAAGERGGEAVCEPEVRVGLGEGGRDPAAPGREHHRPGHEAAASEYHVRTATREDACARDGSPAGQQERAGELRAGTPREAGDPEGVELVARGRDERRLSAIRRPCERHAHAARPQRLRDRERRQDVSRRPSGRDQALELALHRHGHRRC